MWPFKTKQQKVDRLLEQLAGKTKRLEYMQSLRTLNNKVPGAFVYEQADLWEEIGVLTERIKSLSTGQ